MAILNIAIPVSGATLDSGLEFQRGNSEVSLIGSTLSPTGLYGLNSDASDTSGNGRNGTTYSMTWDTTSQKVGSACGVFNGSSSYIDIPYDFGTPTTFSVSFWIYLNSLPSGNMAVFSSAPNISNPRVYCIITNTGTIGFYRGSYAYSSTSLTAGTWHHVIITNNGSTTYFYIDNTSAGSVSQSVSPTSQTNFYIGKGYAGYFNGKLDAIYFFDYILSASERTDLWNAGAGTEDVGYPTTSPVAVFTEVDSSSTSTVWDMSSIVNRENLDSETGSIKYQYSYHNVSGSPSWNGTWLTLAQLQAEADPTGQYFQLKAQFISDGTQDASLAEMYISADVSTGGGACDYPLESDVRQGVSFDSGVKTGTLVVPSASDVRDGTVFDNGTAGALDLPAESDVRLNTTYDNSTKTGTLDLPSVSDVRDGTTYDNNTKTGTLDLPAESDVRQSVTYDNSTKTGTLSPSIEFPLEIIDISDEYEVVEI